MINFLKIRRHFRSSPLFFFPILFVQSSGRSVPPCIVSSFYIFRSLFGRISPAFLSLSLLNWLWSAQSHFRSRFLCLFWSKFLKGLAVHPGLSVQHKRRRLSYSGHAHINSAVKTFHGREMVAKETKYKKVLKKTILFQLENCSTKKLYLIFKSFCFHSSVF